MELQNKMGILLKTVVGVTRTYPYGVFFMKHFVSNKVQHVVFLAKTIDIKIKVKCTSKICVRMVCKTKTSYLKTVGGDLPTKWHPISFIMPTNYYVEYLVYIYQQIAKLNS